jgi:hypothetical protein
MKEFLGMDGGTSWGWEREPLLTGRERRWWRQKLDTGGSRTKSQVVSERFLVRAVRGGQQVRNSRKQRALGDAVSTPGEEGRSAERGAKGGSGRTADSL